MTLYIPPLFRVEDRRALAAFIADHAFGTLVTSGPAGLMASHIPFLVDEGAGGSLRLLGHFARANPHWKALEEAQHALAIFEGPHAYVSPTWYEHHPAVPTWNYSVVHARGKARLTDDAGLRDIVARLSATYEAGNAKPWRIEDQPAEFIGGLLKTIVGFAIEVAEIEGKFKLSQNRPGNDAERTAAALEARGDGALAALMRAHRARSRA